MGAIGTEACLIPLREHQNDDVLEVAETCQMALQRIQVGSLQQGVQSMTNMLLS